MGQGIISRSNPGNTGDKVGDIKITTRNTLGDKWALCNGSMNLDLEKDPLNSSHWKDVDINPTDIADEFLFPLSEAGDITFFGYHRCNDGYVMAYAEENTSVRHVFLIKIIVNNDGSITLDDPISIAFDYAAFTGFPIRRIIVNMEDRHVGILMYDEVDPDNNFDTEFAVGMFDSDINSSFDRTSFQYGNLITFTTKNKIICHEDISGYTHLFSIDKDGNIVSETLYADGTSGLIDDMEGNYICTDYINDIVYIHIVLSTGNSVFARILIGDDVYQINATHNGSLRYKLIGKYLLQVTTYGYNTLYRIDNGNLVNVGTITISGSGVEVDGMGYDLDIFYDANKLLIIQASISGIIEDEDGNFESVTYGKTIVLKGTDASLENCSYDFVLDSEDDTIEIKTGDFTGLVGYFRARGLNQICCDSTPEISVDDESYCFIKIKD